ncbi:MAG TPA: two-component regulator propeller domain-containing protein, partial [Bacteroidia bacterium]
RIYSGVDNGHPMVPMQAIVDMGNPKVTWFADYINGVVKNYDTWGGTNYFAPMGPNTSEVYSMSVSNQDLWVARGNHSDTWGGVYNEAEAYKFSNESWSSFTKNEIPALDTMRDIVSVAIDPSNKDHVYLGTLGQGLVELNSGALVNVWNEANTNNALQSTCVGNFHWVGIYGLTFDQNGNLWISNSGTANPLVVRKADGTWQSFSFSGMTPNCITNGSLIVNQYNQKWMVLPRQNGLFVYDENGTWGVNDDKKIHLSFPACVANTSGNSADLPTDALCLAEDKSGDIWLGTDKGIAVFYCPDQVFASGGCKAQQIFIQQDGHTQILLATEIVTAIAV